ncbi:MAG: tripartite tricarboxylate transporter substrate binding protein [Betaproteobacteria bacterium]
MDIFARQLLSFVRKCNALVIAAAGLAYCGVAVAQAPAYPSRPITIVVPHAAGGPVDSVGRLFGRKLGELLHTPVVVENRAGASGMIGAAYVAAAQPDGYTLYINASIHAINSLLYKERMKFDAVKDFTPISLLATGELVFCVSVESSISTVKEFVDKARSTPEKITFANTGSGSGGHIATEQFLHDAGLRDILLVLYKGTAPALQAVAGNQVTAVVAPTLSAVPLVKGGRMRALAVTSRNRSPLLPDVPTMDEVGMKNFEFYTWYGFWGPANLPAPILKALNDAAANIMAMPDVKSTLVQAGFQSSYKGPEDFKKFIADDMASNRKVIEAANIKVE